MEHSDLATRLGTLRNHPRLLLDRQVQQLRQQIASTPQLNRWFDQLDGAARKMLEEPPSRYHIPDGRRLLATSRQVLSRVYTLGLVFRVTEDSQFKHRLWEELRAAAAFPDWNPSHFLDTAEMTHAFAIAVDWLHESWDANQREQLTNAILRHGLEVGVEAYRHIAAGGDLSRGRWVGKQGNWNLVCNGGLLIGALAIADQRPELAEEVFCHGLASIDRAMGQFAPDGAWPEGVHYWGYGTQYLVTLLAALDSALGHTFNLDTYPGVDRTGLFPLHMTGVTGDTANFGDDDAKPISAPHLFWLARRYNLPVCAEYRRRCADQVPHALDLLWYDERVPAQPLDRHYCTRRIQTIAIQSAHEDDQAYLALQPGANYQGLHSHLDLGSYILEAKGVRWVVDLGKENYNLPNYFNYTNRRWQYYRTRAEGHNTLVINPGSGPDQNTQARVAVDRFISAEGGALAILDLTDAYLPIAKRVRRGFMFVDRSHVLVQDEIELNAPGDIWSFVHTDAEIDLADDGRSALLSKADAKVWLYLHEPASAVFHLMPARPLASSPDPEGQDLNDVTRKVAVHLSQVDNVCIAMSWQWDRSTLTNEALRKLEQWYAASIDGP